MRYLIVSIMLVVSACSNLTETERRFVGNWSWYIENDGYEDSGYLRLEKDGTYTFVIKFKNPTETIENRFEENSHFKWYLTDDKVCLSLGEKTSPVCDWSFSFDKSGNPILSFSGINGIVTLNHSSFNSTK
ncbi:MAG: hypothetical protein ACRBHB_06375 [Arenicella sp.]